MARVTKKVEAVPDISTHVFGNNVEADLIIMLYEGQRLLPRFNAALVENAFRFCADEHVQDVRATGEPDYTH